MFVKHRLDALTHRSDRMIRAVEERAVSKDQPHVSDEVLGGIIARIDWVRIGLRRVRRN